MDRALVSAGALRVFRPSAEPSPVGRAGPCGQEWTRVEPRGSPAVRWTRDRGGGLRDLGGWGSLRQCGEGPPQATRVPPPTSGEGSGKSSPGAEPTSRCGPVQLGDATGLPWAMLSRRLNVGVWILREKPHLEIKCRFQLRAQCVCGNGLFRATVVSSVCLLSCQMPKAVALQRHLSAGLVALRRLLPRG